MSTDILTPTTKLARQPRWSTLATLEGYATAHSAPSHELLRSIITGPIVADQYAYALLDSQTQTLFAKRGLTLLDTSNVEAVEAALMAGGLLYTTTMQEPFLTVPDLGALAALAQAGGATMLIDTTLTPLLTTLPTNSLALHRHSGLLLGKPDSTAILLDHSQVTENCLPIPELATLPARIRTHSGNAQAAADVLAGHPQVRAVYYAGLSTHPQFEYAAEQFPEGFGGLLGLEVRQHQVFTAQLGQVWHKQKGYGTAYSTFSSNNDQVLQLWLGLEDICDLLCELEAALD